MGWYLAFRTWVAELWYTWEKIPFSVISGKMANYYSAMRFFWLDNK